jgi:uncharacterized protein (DUF2147 family)
MPSLSKTISYILILALVAWAVPLHGNAQTAAQSPVGLWKTFGDDGKSPRGLVRIYEKDGEIQGVTVKSLVPGEENKPAGLCVYCKGDLKNHSMDGLVFMTRLKWTGDEYGNGDIVDPDTGTVYSASIKVLPDGKHLAVRGYVGMPLFGRSQTWERADQ